MKKLTHNSSAVLNGGVCRENLCKWMMAVFAVATPAFFPVGAIVGLGAFGTALWACNGC